MKSDESELERAGRSQAKWRKFAVTTGRIGLGIALLVAWKVGADAAGPLYAADPINVFHRIVSDSISGSLPRHIYVTLRLSVEGFAIGCTSVSYTHLTLPTILRV